MGSRQDRSSRPQLAYIAARMMAEDGVPDFAAARRKLARQSGCKERDLPDDREIGAALRSYQALFQLDSQPSALRRLRSAAVDAMEWLAAYDPWLVGSVLLGTAGEHSDIQLHVYTDRGKELEMFLLGSPVPCQFRERRVELGGRPTQIPVVLLEFHDAQVELSVFSSADLRLNAARSNATPDVLPQRARLERVRALLDEEDPGE